jgi:hypothetical protein
MSKEIVDLFEYILDQIEPRWRTNDAVVETLDRLRDGKSKRFTPPTLEEVYVELKRLKVRHPFMQSDKFWNFYESKNWMIGKNKMKNWKAAIKTWNFEKDNLIL